MSWVGAAMIVHDVAQGSGAWLDARAGIPTASCFGRIVTPSLTARTGQTPQSYMDRLLAERWLGHPVGDDGTGYLMDRGSILESEAIPWYEMRYDCRVRRVGFVTTDDGRLGCSPDGLVGDSGGIEIKCPGPQKHMSNLRCDGVPDEYMPQVLGVMWICGLAWLDWVSYHPVIPCVVRRVTWADLHDNEVVGPFCEAITAFAAELDSEWARMNRQPEGDQ